VYASDARVGARHSINFTEECLRFAAGGGPSMDAAWDRGALVAVPPSLRPRYARVIADRLAPGGRMLLVATSYEAEGESDGTDRSPDDLVRSTGLPFSVMETDVRSLYEPLGLTVRELSREERHESAPPKMREGLKSMRETAYLVEKPRQKKRRR
jgi:thiopurine S-methyltransferase